MQAVLDQIHHANVKALLLSRVSMILTGLNCAAMIVLIITWVFSTVKEGGDVLARYAACGVGFILLAIATFLSVMVHRFQPSLMLYYVHEAISILTLIIIVIAMGMNNVIVDLCNRSSHLANTACGSHVAELITELFVCFSMAFNYASTQQRIVNFIDKGILDGIKGRSNGGMSQLP